MGKVNHMQWQYVSTLFNNVAVEFATIIHRKTVFDLACFFDYLFWTRSVLGIHHAFVLSTKSKHKSRVIIVMRIDNESILVKHYSKNLVYTVVLIVHSYSQHCYWLQIYGESKPLIIKMLHTKCKDGILEHLRWLFFCFCDLRFPAQAIHFFYVWFSFLNYFS